MRQTSLVLTLIFAVVCTLKIANSREIYVDNKALCERTKGVWRLYNNSCADNCASKFGTPLCTSYPAFTCDCGEKRCWDGGKCIADKVAKIAYDEMVKIQEEKRIKELKDAGINPDDPKQILISQSPQNQTPQDQVPQNHNPQNQTPNSSTLPNQKTQELQLPPVVEAPKPQLSEQVKLAMENPEMAKKLQEKQTLCEKQNGKWIEFPNGCADNCASKVASVNVCTQSITFSCKCEESKCWDGISNQCISLEEYKKGLTVF